MFIKFVAKIGKITHMAKNNVSFFAYICVETEENGPNLH